MVRPGPIFLVLLTALPLAGGCMESECVVVEALPGGPGSGEPSPPLYLGMGDSIVSLYGPQCLGVMACAGLELGAYIEDESVGAQRFTNPETDIDIMHQYIHGAWEWVIMNGGGNDLVQECGCKSDGHDPDACQDVIDSLAMPETRTGDMVEFIDMVNADTNDTASILILGYYEFPESSTENRDNCNPYVEELNLRYQQVAEQHWNVFLMETGEVMDFDVHPEYFSIDHDHPSFEGSEAMGCLVADFIKSHVPICTDVDGDGYGDPGSPVCTYLERDCDDLNAEANPGATEGPVGDATCSDGSDNDCDQHVDQDDPGCTP